MSGIVFRPMKKEDVPEVAVLEQVCFRSPWTERMLRAELKNKAAYYQITEAYGRVIGYVGMWILFDEAHVTNVAVAPAFRRQGLGRRQMIVAMEKAILLGAMHMTLEVRESNFAAQALYTGLGFEEAGRRVRYYPDTGEDALIMWNRDMVRTLVALPARTGGVNA